MVELHYLTGLNRRRFIFFFYLRSSSWAWTSKNSWAIFAFSSFTARWLPLLGDVGCHNTNLHLIFPAIHAKEIFALLKAVDLDWFMYHWFMAGGPNWFMYQSMNQTIRMCSWFRSDSWSQSRNLELESLSILLGTLDSKWDECFPHCDKLFVKDEMEIRKAEEKHSSQRKLLHSWFTKSRGNNQCAFCFWCSLKGLMLKLKLQYFGHLMGRDPDAGKNWGQEEKGPRGDEMIGWHHWLNGHGFWWTPRVGDGQGGLVCCGSWGHKESDMAERLNWTDWIYKFHELSSLLHFASWCVE